MGRKINKKKIRRKILIFNLNFKLNKKKHVKKQNDSLQNNGFIMYSLAALRSMNPITQP